MEVVKAAEVEPIHTPEGSMRPLVFGTNASLVHLEVPPGMVVPPHAHPREGIVYCLSGSVELASGPQRTALLTVGCAMRVQAAQEIGLRNPGKKPAALLLISSPPASSSAAELRAQIEAFVAKHKDHGQ